MVAECSLSSDFNNTVGSKFTTHLTAGRQPQRTRNNSLCWQVYHTSYCGQTAFVGKFTTHLTAGRQPLLASLLHILMRTDSLCWQVYHTSYCGQTAFVGKFTTHLNAGRQPQRTRNNRLCWQVYHTSTLSVQVTYRHVECPANICRYPITSCALHKLNLKNNISAFLT